MKSSQFRTPLNLKCLCAVAVALAAAAGVAPRAARAQTVELERGRARQMLSNIKGEVKKHYYDATFRGVDLDARFKAAEEKIKQATTVGQMFGIIAQALADLEDSHTFFLPPGRRASVDYGWQMQMVGDKCFVAAVRPGSDAEKQGLKRGDLVLEIDGFQITRENLWKFEYLYYALRPRPGMNVTAQSPGGEPRRLAIAAKVERRDLDLTTGAGFGSMVREAEAAARVSRHRYYEPGDAAFIWKMPGFDLAESKIDEIMDKVKKHKALVLDLRGNGGGYVVTLERLVGHLFDRDIKIADLKGRKEMKPSVAKRRAPTYTGKLIVLVDSRSGSASELFARVVQLEKRGTVVGDRTAGAVMQSRLYDMTMGVETITVYGVSITEADVIMSDGRSLERIGVTPDEVRLPTADDLAAGRDPVLAYALSLAGIEVDAAKAGALFPVEWK
ncbi:MAG TPA: S41 family peptidase [Pyrinomonadaceae bacterium]|nr:S41 family peptidase [Pyrinomonadaceae bacterium]